MPINKFTTLLDLSRQAKIITGETATFDGKILAGIPFSGYPTGVNTATTVSLGVASTENAVFSGNTGTTVFDVSNPLSPYYNPLFSGYTATTWTNPLFSATTSGLTLPITILSADTQVVGPFWTLTQTGYTGDYIIGTEYTGYSVTYSFINVSQFSAGLFSGITSASQENFSAGTLDYKGPLDYLSSKENISVDGRLITNKITITNGASSATTNYVLSQIDDTGKGGWNSLSSLLSGSCLPIVNLETINDCSSGITFNSDVTINGDVIVNGSATTINTEIIRSKDNNIILNYSGNHLTSIGGGLTLEDGVSNGVDSRIYSDSNGVWLFDPSLSASSGTINSLSADTIGSSGDCVNDLYVSNLYGCSTIGVHDIMELGTGIIRSSGGTGAELNLKDPFGPNGTWSITSDNGGYTSGSSWVYGQPNNGTQLSYQLSTTEAIGIGIYSSIVVEPLLNTAKEIVIFDNTGGFNKKSGDMDKRAIFIGTRDSTIYTGVVNTVVIGGSGLTATESDTVYVSKLNINHLGTGTTINNLGLDINGNVVTGIPPFSGGSGNCITDLYVSNIHSCSPLNINPLDEGNVYFGSTSGVTIDVTNSRVGIGTINPSEKLHISSGDMLVENTNGKYYTDIQNTTGPLTILSGNSSGVSRFGVIVPTYDSVTLGVRGPSAGFPGYGKQGDAFIYSSGPNNGFNLISAPGTGTDDYIRFYAGSIATSTPDIHIQGSGVTRGYVGIGTKTPTERLTVSGTSFFKTSSLTTGTSPSFYYLDGVSTPTDTSTIKSIYKEFRPTTTSSSIVVGDGTLLYPNITSPTNGEFYSKANLLLYTDNLSLLNNTEALTSEINVVQIQTNTGTYNDIVKSSSSVLRNLTAGGTINKYVGFWMNGFDIDFTHNGTTNNIYGFYMDDQSTRSGNIPPTSNRWGIYIDDDARNYFAGSVGIGTSNPQYKLDILDTNSRLYYDPTSVGGSLSISGKTNLPRFTLIVPPYLTKPLALGSMGIRAWDDTLYSGYGKVGDMHIYASNSANGLNIINQGPGTNTEDYIRFYAGRDALFNPDIHIQGSGVTRGYVGIGTSSPSEKLDVDGKTKTTTLQVTSGATNGYVLVSDSVGNAIWQSASGATSGVTFWTASTGVDAIVVKNSGSVASGLLSLAQGYQTTASGDYSHSEGLSNISSGVASHAEGGAYFGKLGLQSFPTSATTYSSHSEGVGTLASGQGSHAEGWFGISSGAWSHSEGQGTTSLGQYSHSEGGGSISLGSSSHAEGINTNSNGTGSHAEGVLTLSLGPYSHAEGDGSISSGTSSHAEGALTLSLGDYSHAEGSGTTASGIASHAEGYFNIASGVASHSEGGTYFGKFGLISLPTSATTYSSHSEGAGTLASGDGSHAEGRITISSGFFSHSEGFNTSATNQYSHAEGENTLASGSASHAEGINTIASGSDSHAEGNTTTASGNGSHAEGSGSSSLGLHSHAEGSATIASSTGSHSEGLLTLSSGLYSHSEGNSTSATTIGSHSEGWGTIAYENYQHVSGRYNTTGNTNQYFIIGKGTSNASRSNAFRVDSAGNVYGAGATYNSGADYAEYFESLSGDSIPYGTVVELVDDKIKVCVDAYNAMGVISSNPTLIGNNEGGTADEWVGKYEKDEWGRYIMEDYSYDVIDYMTESGETIYKTITEQIPKLSQDFNPNMIYIPRSERPEWNVVGLVGQVRVLKNQQIPSRWIKMKDINNDIALYLIR